MLHLLQIVADEHSIQPVNVQAEHVLFVEFGYVPTGHYVDTTHVLAVESKYLPLAHDVHSFTFAVKLQVLHTGLQSPFPHKFPYLMNPAEQFPQTVSLVHVSHPVGHFEHDFVASLA